MVTRRVTGKEVEVKNVRKRRPATTPEGRENQLINMAVSLAEKQMAEGTASSQVITHYLKLGSSRERLEQERMGGEIELNKAKIEAMEGQKRMEELIGEALNAFRSYSGVAPPELEPGEDD